MTLAPASAPLGPIYHPDRGSYGNGHPLDLCSEASKRHLRLSGVGNVARAPALDPLGVTDPRHKGSYNNEHLLDLCGEASDLGQSRT